MDIDHRPESLCRLDLNLLRVFVAVFDARGVSAAGERLHLTQPAVSNALARLRAALGDRLFVRTPGGFVPTPRAERIAPVVRDALARLAEALDPEPAFEPRASQRRFRVGMTDAGELVFVPKIVSALAQRAPGVRIEIVPLAFEPLAAALADGTLDAAVGPLALRDADEVQVTPLFTERYVGIVRRGGTLARAARAATPRPREAPHPALPAEALRAAPLLAVMQTSTRHRVVLEAIAAERLEPNVIGRVPHFAALLPLLAAYDALAVVPSQIAAIFARRGAVLAVELPLRLAPYEVVLARHRRFDGDAGLEWFCALLTERLRA